MVYDFDKSRLAKRMEVFADDFNGHIAKWVRKGRPKDVDNFVDYERIKWSRNLKNELRRESYLNFDATFIRGALYRPFTLQQLYFADIAIDEPGQIHRYFPKAKVENSAICVTGAGSFRPFQCLMASVPLSMDLLEKTQCFPLYTYDADGGHRQDNVTDWALEQFRTRYPGVKLTKRDIFYYVYAVLHHPVYRESYAANLRRELPRIPFAADFAAFAKAGEKLAALHVGYEAQKEFKLTRVATPDLRPDWRVERMKLSPDKTALVYNDCLTLAGIPAAAHDYRLGNRSALEWVIDQYRVERAKENPDVIVSDPNRPDDEEYILRLVGQVVTVSVETMKIVKALPPIEGKPVAAAGYTQAELDAGHIYATEDRPEAG